MEQQPLMEGKQMVMLFAPKKKRAIARPSRDVDRTARAARAGDSGRHL